MSRLHLCDTKFMHDVVAVVETSDIIIKDTNVYVVLTDMEIAKLIQEVEKFSKRGGISRHGS